MTKTEQARLQAWRFKVLQQAAESSRNVARTCRHFGISRQAFYRWKRRHDAYGAAGLWDRPRRPHRSPRALAPEVVSRILPWQNGADESFNGKFRDQHLSLQWFRNRADAKVSIEHWRRHYNAVRPHSSLGYLTISRPWQIMISVLDGSLEANSARSRARVAGRRITNVPAAPMLTASRCFSCLASVARAQAWWVDTCRHAALDEGARPEFRQNRRAERPGGLAPPPAVDATCRRGVPPRRQS